MIVPFLTYLFLNVCYSLGAKKFALFDILIIAIGFCLRLLIGSLASSIQLSAWIVITTFFLSLFLAFTKRRDDVLIFNKSGQKMRESISGYNLIFLDICIAISATMSVLSYFMWSISSQTIEHFNSPYLYLSGLFVVFGVMRYLQLIFVYSWSGSPTEIVLKDKVIHGVILGWILSFVIFV